MNIFQAILNKLNSEPAAEDMILQFVAAQMNQDHVQILVSSDAMLPAYIKLATRCRSMLDNSLLNINTDLRTLSGEEVVMVHPVYDADLVSRVAKVAKRIILVVERYDTHQGYDVHMANLEKAHGIEIVLAYLEEGEVSHVPYSPTEAHYTGHKIRRMIRA